MKEYKNLFVQYLQKSRTLFINLVDFFILGTVFIVPCPDLYYNDMVVRAIGTPNNPIKS